MRRFLIIYEKSPEWFGVYVPRFAGCTSAGATREEVKINIAEAIKLHIEVIQDYGMEIPDSISESEMLVIS